MNRCFHCTMPCRADACSHCLRKYSYKKVKQRAKHHEPTEAELEALIAEQSKNLPKWWNERHGQRNDLAVEERK